VKFWDSSAIVPLLVEEPSSRGVVSEYERDPEMLVWWASEVECVSALARLEREGSLSEAGMNEALRRLSALARSWRTVEPVERVRQGAVRLLRVHPLRAADALQLSAAAVASEDQPQSLPFVTLDDRLALAANREGFAVRGLKQIFERQVGDGFVSWLNDNRGTTYRLVRSQDAPDLVYASGTTELAIEVTAAYYDNDYGEFLWGFTRPKWKAPADWSGDHPDRSLIEAVARAISEKSMKKHGPNCVLLVYVPMQPLTTAEELGALLAKQSSSADPPFAGVYVVGLFPGTTSAPGGYEVIPIKDL
jgi:predicted nucleic acid-binding protein